MAWFRVAGDADKADIAGQLGILYRRPDLQEASSRYLVAAVRPASDSVCHHCIVAGGAKLRAVSGHFDDGDTQLPAKARQAQVRPFDRCSTAPYSCFPWNCPEQTGEIG